MEKHVVKRYRESFKLQVVTEYEAGASESELRIAKVCFPS